MKTRLILAFSVVLCFVVVDAESEILSPDSGANFKAIGRRLVEEGRTFVHHTLKRFMIILPAIFFKLGIAFTLLILVALAAVNNGFIGFMLLVVGLSSVLARLQDSRRPAALPYISPLPPYHHHVWDRSDSVQPDLKQDTKSTYYGYSGQNMEYSPQWANYYAKYTTAKV